MSISNPYRDARVFYVTTFTDDNVPVMYSNPIGSGVVISNKSAKELNEKLWGYCCWWDNSNCSQRAIEISGEPTIQDKIIQVHSIDGVNYKFQLLDKTVYQAFVKRIIADQRGTAPVFDSDEAVQAYFANSKPYG